MSYIINNSRGQVIAVVADGTVNTTSTSLSLVGRGINGYGESENENYVFLLENFAASTAPTNPIPGQLWYNTELNTINVYTISDVWEIIPNQDYVQAQKISPIFTGTPTAPTATAGTATAQLATTAFVTNSPQFTGVPTAPTATAGTATTQIATTAFVTNSPQFTGIPTAPTGDLNDSNQQLATKAFVQAQKNNTQLTGIATAVTALPGTATAQLATTAFVTNSPQFAGVPTAPTATAGTATAQIATTAFVTNSPQFTGIPTAPTATAGTATTQIATTQFVQQAVGNVSSLGSMATQNANAVNITGGAISGIAPVPVASGGTSASTPADARNNLGLGSISTQNSNLVSITGGQIIGITPIRLLEGGTGATTASQARINLGLGSISQQESNQVSITGGNITGITDIAVADGGTGASTALGARQNLGIGSIATQNSNSVEITGGNISGVLLNNLLLPIPVVSGGTGATTPAGARNNLGLGSMSQQSSGSVFISGGSISGISPLGISSGGTGASNAQNARSNLGLNNVAYTNQSQTFTSTQSFDENVVCAKNLIVEDNLIFSGAGTFGYNRIQGYLAGSSINDRLFFQDGAPNTASFVNVMPNGTANLSAFLAYNSSSPSNSSVAGLYIDNSKASIYSSKYGTASDLPLTFDTGGNERMRIDAPGRFFVGRTTSLLVGAKFTIDAGEVPGTEQCLVLAATLNTPGMAHSFIVNKGTANYEALSFRNNTSTEVGRIDCFASSTAFVTSSDYRIKENIVPLSDAISKVVQLNPVCFTWKADGSLSEGFIAHEVAEVAPYAVTGEKDAVNQDGSIKPQGVDYGKLVPILTAALQDTINKIQTLENRIGDLEARLGD